MNYDGLSPMRGIVNGLLLGATMWLLLFVALAVFGVL